MPVPPEKFHKTPKNRLLVKLAASGKDIFAKELQKKSHWCIISDSTVITQNNGIQQGDSVKPDMTAISCKTI